MNLPRVLLIAGYPPEGGGGGGVNLRSLLADYPLERLGWLALQSDITVKPWWRAGIARWAVTRRVPGRSRYHFIQRFWEMAGFRWEAAEACRLARKINATWRPDCVWVVVDQNTLWAAGQVVRELGMPWHITVQDDPAIARRLNGRRLPSSWQHIFDHLYTNAVTRDCTSHGMVKYYRARYGVDAFMVSRTIRSEKVKSSRARPILRGDCIDILMGGWGDRTSPWPSNLVEALKIASGRRRRRFRLNAFDPALGRFSGEHVRVMQRMPETRFNELLATMDLGYAPDPLDPAYRDFVTTSLPTKLVTYVGAALPCLYHGPCDSTIGEMFGRHQAGVIVDSDDPGEIARGFLQLIDAPEPFRDACCALAMEDFNHDVLVKRIYDRFSQ